MRDEIKKSENFIVKVLESLYKTHEKTLSIRTRTLTLRQITTL